MRTRRVVAGAGVLVSTLSLLLACASYGGPLPYDGPLPPPSPSAVSVQTVTFNCRPLVAEYRLGTLTTVRTLLPKSSCYGKDAGAGPTCSQPAKADESCSEVCPYLTEWEQGGGTTTKHVTDFLLLDDGRDASPVAITVALKLSTPDGTVIWEGSRTKSLVATAYGDAYRHRGMIEFKLDSEVYYALGRRSC